MYDDDTSYKIGRRFHARKPAHAGAVLPIVTVLLVGLQCAAIKSRRHGACPTKALAESRCVTTRYSPFTPRPLSRLRAAAQQTAG